jgi:class 3 adenylate cyclase
MNRMTGLDELPAARRLAAILAADVVGYSRLMGQDEVGTLRALKAMRADILDPLITSRHGRIVKTTGDGVLAEFSSVVDAVMCAVTIQREMVALAERRPGAALTLRIGVNIGDIIIDGEDIFGDGVNLASRLESICEPGGVTISRAVHEQVHDKLALPFVDQGERSVKNIVRPVRVFGLGPRAIAAMPHPSLAARWRPQTVQDEEEDETPQPRRRKWRLRLVLIVIAAIILARQQPVRHAFENIVALVTTTRDKGPAERTPVPTKPAVLTPLPPPVFVAPTPGSGEKPAAASAGAEAAPASAEGPAAAKPSVVASPPAATPAPEAKPAEDPGPPLAPPLQLHPQD